MPGTQVRIVDEDDKELPRGEIGEIAIRGPQLMEGYWNLPDATANALRGGWMYTGDAGRMDEEGFVYIQDRIKDMIVSGGENIYPKEVENALFEHPNVADAAVIGVPSEQWGEAVLAFVATRDGQTIEPDELIAFCRERLAGYKVPRAIESIAQIPRNASGKVLKKDLREPYWRDVDRLYLANCFAQRFVGLGWRMVRAWRPIDANHLGLDLLTRHVVDRCPLGRNPSRRRYLWREAHHQ